jgi:hypothetical protein
MKRNKGITLLVSLITVSALLLVSFVVVNVATKELKLGYSNQESQYAFYNTDTGTDCAIYWDLKAATSPFDPYVTFPQVISCNNQAVTFNSAPPIVGGYATTTFTINLTKGCVVLDVVKRVGVSTTTTVNSKGYNTCSVGALRRFERGIKVVY